MGTLYMIRHGQASFGSANYDLISETGVLQSRILAEYLLAVGLAPDALYSGAMERQKDTAGAMVALYREKELPLLQVPVTNLLGPEEWGLVIAQERLGPGRIHHCMRWLGICSRVYDLMCKRATERIISPDRKTIATKQIIQAWIAESAAEILAARLMTLHTAWKIENLGVKEAREEISLIKFYVAGVLQKVVDRALQVHGGLGMTDDTIISFFFRHERAARIYDGADEVHKMSVAKRILKEYAGRTVR